MESNKQFFKGENIEITAMFDTDAGFTSLSIYTLLVYPDTLDLSDSTNRTNKMVTIKHTDTTESTTAGYHKTATTSGVTFVIPFGKTNDLNAGDYTIELVFGDVENNNTTERHISRQNKAFTLVDSAGEYLGESLSSNAMAIS